MALACCKIYLTPRATNNKKITHPLYILAVTENINSMLTIITVFFYYTVVRENVEMFRQLELI